MTSSHALPAGFDVTDARVLAVNGYPVQRQPSAPSQATQQPLQGAPAAAPDAALKASNIPASRAAYAILGLHTSPHLHHRSKIPVLKQGSQHPSAPDIHHTLSVRSPTPGHTG